MSGALDEEKDLKIAELERLLASKDALIRELQEQLEEAVQDAAATIAMASGGAGAQEVEELHAILQAQEAAIQDQTKIMENQSQLIQDLNAQLQRAQASNSASNPRRSPSQGLSSSGTGPSQGVGRRKSGPGSGNGTPAPGTPVSQRSSGYAAAPASGSRSNATVGLRSVGSTGPPSVGAASGGAGSPCSTPGLCTVPTASVLRGGNGTTPRGRGGAVVASGGTERDRLGASGGSNSGLGVRGPSPRATPRQPGQASSTTRGTSSGAGHRSNRVGGGNASSTAVQSNRGPGGAHGGNNSSSVMTSRSIRNSVSEGVPPALPILSQEA
eukprot:TRINITY_DN35057_c0_g1_i1.p1 TRINITY_DN35057_c0_g1~~TRINITY_DN35057_c0_g1_i1.p1  ORF type:complete len:327 (-),score=72.64 TRINITY_DN35057_c0_g1_i1:118-1098(-)